MEQFARTKRYLERVRDIYSGMLSSSGHDKDAYDDDVISFFIHCYHVRDWIVHLNTVGVTAKQVDSFINRHIPLKICADLANGSKHCRLTRNLRTEQQPHIFYKEHITSTWLTENGGSEHMESKYTIMAGTEIHDALELAEACVLLWSEFIEQMKAHNNSIQTTANANG